MGAGFASFAVGYHYARRGVWGLPPPSPYRELATTCVSLFFMITAYPFIGKLIDARDRPIDWLTLFVSRVLRLMPLYLVAITAMFGMVGVLSGWTLRDPWSTVGGQMIH